MIDEKDHWTCSSIASTSCLECDGGGEVPLTWTSVGARCPRCDGVGRLAVSFEPFDGAWGDSFQGRDGLYWNPYFPRYLIMADALKEAVARQLYWQALFGPNAKTRATRQDFYHLEHTIRPV